MLLLNKLLLKCHVNSIASLSFLTSQAANSVEIKFFFKLRVKQLLPYTATDANKLCQLLLELEFHETDTDTDRH